MADEQDEGGWQIKTQKREKHVDADLLENGYEEEPDFSDPEGFIDDVSDDELLGDLLKKRPKETDGIDSVIVVDNVPSIGPERLEKLQNVIRKIFQKFGKIQNEFYPQENGVTKGYIFLEYSNPSSATEAVKMANGYKLDKNHTFIVNLFSDFDKFANVPDEWEPPKPQPYEDPGNLHSWLLNEDCYDQYSVIYDGGDTTAILLNQQNGEPLLAKERARWTETYVRWSPQGTYLATLHAKGIALWGAEDFKQIMRYSHTGVQLIDFSPCERYLVTFSPLPDSKDDPQAIIIWDLRTGQKKRGFHCENASVWPIFKWNHDGSYFARMTPDTLGIYETPSMGLLDKKSIKVVGLKDFGWSPSDNVIAYWTPEDQNVPARVTLIQLPTRRELCAKNLFSVADCKIHWQKSGDYLCVKVDRYAKKKEEKDNQVKYSGIYHNFNLFRMREKQIPVDTIEIKETIVAFAWEPVGHRFAFLMGESPRISVCAYNIKPGGNAEPIKTLEKRQANHLFWCPTGQFLVVGGLRSMNGVLEFIDTSDMTVMAQAEHFMATDVEWDPTGRYVATGVSWWGHKVDNAYWIWNFQGKLLHKQPMERFCQLLWRPRPPTLLSNEQIKEIKKNLKSVYTPRFEMKDRMSLSKASKELVEKRHRLMEEYKIWREEIAEEFYDSKERRLELRDGIDTDELESHIENFEEETIEFLVKVEESIIEE